MYRGLVLSPLLFIFVLEALSPMFNSYICTRAPWVLLTISKDDMEGKMSESTVKPV